jgi:hypothetical protein
MYTTTTKLENMNFVRHYRLDDGSVIGDNFGTLGNHTIVDQVRESDNEMQLIRFKREGGKDVMLVNWQVHPHRTGGETVGNISADIVGAMRMYMEPQMDCLMAYFTGASGNLNPTSRIASENVTFDYLEQGTIMAQEAILACDTMTEQKTGKVQILRKDQEVMKEGNPVKFVTYAFSVGDVAFVTAPYEMFAVNGMTIKEASPYKYTMIVTASSGYIPSKAAYAYRSYESDTCYFVEGVAEKLQDKYIEMLGSIQ